MRYFYSAILFLGFFLESSIAFAQVKAKFSKYSIDPTINAQLDKARKQSELKFPRFGESYWFLSDKESMTEIVGTSQIYHFLDTITIYTDAVCDCMKKKDTIYLAGGFSYGGGFGFELKIVGNLYTSNLSLWGEKRYKIDSVKDYIDEIHLNAAYQSLKLQTNKALKLGNSIKGVYIIESEEYYDRNQAGISKMYLKLLFNCKLDGFIAF